MKYSNFLNIVTRGTTLDGLHRSRDEHISRGGLHRSRAISYRSRDELSR